MAVAVLGDEIALDEPVRPRAVEAWHRDTTLYGTMTEWRADTSRGYLHRVGYLLRLIDVVRRRRGRQVSVPEARVHD